MVSASWPPLPPDRAFSAPTTPRGEGSDNPDSNEAAVTAAATGNFSSLSRWLDAGGDPDACAYGLTLLCTAADHGQMRIVELLLQRHASVDACAPDDTRTALIRACEQRHAPVVRMLLAAKASLTHRTADGLRALDVLRETTRREVLHGLDFVRLMDCTRAITNQMQMAQSVYASAQVPTALMVVTEEDDRQLDSWAKRVEREKRDLEALRTENSRRTEFTTLESKLMANIFDARGTNVNDTVSKVTGRLSVRRHERQPKKSQAEEAWERKQSQNTSMRVSQAAGKFLRPVDEKRGY